MWRYALRRLVYAVPILLGVSVVVFALIKMAPGDAADLLIPPETPKEVADQIRAKLGLDKPIHVQYLCWLGRMLRGDLGISIVTNEPVAASLLNALGNTLMLAVPAALLGFTLGIAARRARGVSPRDDPGRLFSATAITGVSLPHYWVGIVLVAIFAVTLNALPAQGMGAGGFPRTWEQVKHLILPVFTLSLIPMGVVSRLVRANVLEIISQEFVGALRAKGLLDRRVLLHVMKNAAPSVMALMGLQLGYLLGGSILVETVFNWPGSGGLMNLAIFRRDVPVLSATILAIAALFVLINIVVDVLQAAVDPRESGGSRSWRRRRRRLRSAVPEPRAALRPRPDDAYWGNVWRRRVPGQGDGRGDPDPLRHRADVDRRAARDHLRSGAGSVFKRLKPPGTPGHWLGTDEVGRDLWTRMVYGGRLSLLCGVVPVFLALLIGGTLGVVAGFAGSVVNTVIMRTMDVLYAFPSILLAIAICGILGAGVGNTILALTVTFMPPIVRISESVTTQVRGLDFVEAARASGGSPLSVLRHHVVNNVLGPILVYATSLISVCIILAAGLSFLGLGVTPPNPEWGLMLNSLRQALWVNPMVAALPGVMIFATSMCFNLMSDGCARRWTCGCEPRCS